MDFFQIGILMMFGLVIWLMLKKMSNSNKNCLTDQEIGKILEAWEASDGKLTDEELDKLLEKPKSPQKQEPENKE